MNALAHMFINHLKVQYPSSVHDISLDTGTMPEYIAVLGAGYTSTGSTPIASRIGYDSLVRVVEGIRLHRLIPGSKLILSGGSKPGTISSAEDMAQLARELGVNVHDIIIEKTSRDTKDEADIIKTIIGTDRFILVTSASHMPRSMALFRNLGMNPIPAPTRSIESRILYRGPNPFFPAAINIEKVEMAFHEYLGMIWAKLRGQI